MAHLAGVGNPPAALRPAIRARRLIGGDPLYLAAHRIAGRGCRTEVFDRPPWKLEQKVVAEGLGAYLDRPDAAEAYSSTG